MLRGPSCRVWFLGETIHSWRLGAQVRHPPLSPPCHMLWAHLLEGEELDRAFQILCILISSRGYHLMHPPLE